MPFQRTLSGFDSVCGFNQSADRFSQVNGCFAFSCRSARGAVPPYVSTRCSTTLREYARRAGDAMSQHSVAIRSAVETDVRVDVMEIRRQVCDDSKAVGEDVRVGFARPFLKRSQLQNNRGCQQHANKQRNASGVL